MLIEIFLNAVAMNTLQYVMVRRLSDIFVGECLGYFRCLFVVERCVNAFTYQYVEDIVHNPPQNMHTQINLAVF